MKKICVFAIAFITILCSFTTSAATVSDRIVQSMMDGIIESGGYSSVTFNGKNIVMELIINNPETEDYIKLNGAKSFSKIFKDGFIREMTVFKWCGKGYDR